MATVHELTALYSNFLLGPRPGAGVCRQCFNLTDGYSVCYTCARRESQLDAVVPISYSVAQEQLHRALAGYKRLGGEVARRLQVELAAVLWRFLQAHEPCVACAAAAQRFDVVATVPSSDRARDEHHPLRELVGRLSGPTRERHERLLLRSEAPVLDRTYDVAKYECSRPLAGAAVLLIDDTWTTGANAHSAAAALRKAGAGRIAAVVIGRHLNRDWHENDRRLSGLARPFAWERCALDGACLAGSAERSLGT
jgi:predicted amidophosphoribosyltransferase